MKLRQEQPELCIVGYRYILQIDCRNSVVGSLNIDPVRCNSELLEERKHTQLMVLSTCFMGCLTK